MSNVNDRSIIGQENVHCTSQNLLIFQCVRHFMPFYEAVNVAILLDLCHNPDCVT